jgi:predicted RNase H-like nuclease (RuvC/YqgF family)
MTTPIGEGAQGGAEGTQSGTGEGTTGANTATDSTASDAGTQSGTDSNPDLTRAQEENASLRERMKAADQRAGRFEAELKQLRDKNLPAAEKLERDFKESQEQVRTLQTANQQLALQVAFLKDNTYTWHNPERALKLVDLSQVEIDAEGNVSGLKDALKALATSDAYLVKTDAEPKETTPPATSPGNNGGNGSGSTSSKQRTARFPALNTRVRRS